MTAQVQEYVKGVLEGAARTAGFGGQATAEIDRVSATLAREFDSFKQGAVNIARTAGERLGATRNQVDDVLRQAGLIDEEVAPRFGGAAPSARVRGEAPGNAPVSREEFNNLLAFARQNGYQG